MPVLGIDIGGTKIAAALVGENAAVMRAATLPTRAGEGFTVSSAQVRAAIRAVWSAEARAIGICAPGPLNPRTGEVLNPPNLPGWRNIPLAADIAREFGVPCRLENDANAAGLAETLFGAARGCENVFYVTLSTGIGTGIIVGGRIYHGKNGAAGEGGHVVVDPGAQEICGCGRRGCIEALASGPALERRAAQLRQDYPGTALPASAGAAQIANGIARGDALALRVLDETANLLSLWLANMITLLDPDMVVIGGGVSQIGEPLFSRLRERTPQHSINPFAAETPIVPALLAGQVGILGAAAVVLSAPASAG